MAPHILSVDEDHEGDVEGVDRDGVAEHVAAQYLLSKTRASQQADVWLVWWMLRSEGGASSESQDEHATAHAAAWLATGLSRLSSPGSRGEEEDERRARRKEVGLDPTAV